MPQENIDELYEIAKDNFDSRETFDALIKEDGGKDELFEIVKENFDSRDTFDQMFADGGGLGKPQPDFTMGNLVGRKPSQAQTPSSASQSESVGLPSESRPPISAAGRSTLPANLTGSQLKQMAKQMGIPEIGSPDDAQYDKLAEKLRGKSFFAAQLEFANQKKNQAKVSRDPKAAYEARKEIKKAYSGVQSALVYEQEQMKPVVEEVSTALGQYENQLGQLKSVFEDESIDPEQRNAAGQQFNALQQEAAAVYAENSQLIEKYNENQKALGSLGRLLPSGDDGARIRNSLDAYIKMNPYSPLNNAAVQGFSNAILPSFMRTVASVYDNELAQNMIPGGDIFGDALAAKVFEIADEVTITPTKEAETSVFDEINSENLQYTVGNILGYMIPAMLSGGAMATTQQASTAAKVVTGSQVYGNFYKEALDAGLTKNEATLFAAVPTLVTAYFGDKGVEAMLANLGKSSTKALIKESVREMSGKSANEILDLSSKFARGFVTGALKEGTQEGVEQLAEMGSKDISNEMLGANFEGDYSIDGYLKGVGEAFTLGAAVGAPLGGVSGVTSRQNIIQSANQAATDPAAEKIYLDTIESMLAQGELGQVDYDQAMSLFQEAKKAVASIPPTVESEVDREEATELIIEQQQLTQQIEATNPAMVAPLQARLDEVNGTLAAIAEGRPREVVSEVKERSTNLPESDKNYQEAQEVNAIVSQENPDASVLLQPKGNDLSLTAVYVGAENRGKGIGTKVLDSVKKQADRLGKKVVLNATYELDSATDLDRLGKFYERNGFVKVGENQYEYSPSTTEQQTAPETQTQQASPLADVESTAKALESADIEALFEKTKSNKYFRGQPTEELPQKDIFISPNEIIGKMYAKGKGVLKNLALKASNLFDIDAEVTKEFNDKLIDAWKKSDNTSKIIPREVLNGEHIGKTYSQVLKEDPDFRRALEDLGYDGLLNNFSHLKLTSPRQEIIVFDKSNLSEINSDLISEAYHKAKQDGSNPELVQAVEKLLTPQQDAVKTGEIEQSDSGKREGTTESQQGQQENRNDQEGDVATSQAETGSGDLTEQGRTQQQTQEVATTTPPTDQGSGQAPPPSGGGNGRRTPPSDDEKKENRKRVRNIMERAARKREELGDPIGAESIRKLGEYTQVSMEQANQLADELIADVGIETAIDISMDPDFAGNVRTAILGRNLNQLADKARKNNSPENVTNLANAIIEFSIYGTNLGQAVSQIQDVINSNPELFFVNALRTKSSSMNNSTMGDPTTTGTRAQIGLSARDAVEAAREAAFNEIMSALIDPLTEEQAMRQALGKAFELSGNDKAVLADMLKALRDQGLLVAEENTETAINAIYDALNGINNQLENPLSDEDIRQIAQTLIATYEKIGAEKIKTELDKALNTESKKIGIRNQDKAIRAFLYGALEDADYLEKYSMMFGGVSSAAFTAEEKAELKRLAELYAKTKNQQGASALATNSVNSQFHTYMNRAFIRQMAPARKFLNRFALAANLISGLRFNWILTAPSTLARVASGTIESATTELFASMLADIAQGRPVAAGEAISKSFGNQKVFFTNADGQQQAVDLNRVLDNIYASIRGMPKMKAGGGQTFTEIEQMIRTNPKRASRILLRALGVSAGRSMTAIDQLIIPITQYYTKSQVMYEIVKELYVQAGKDVKDPLVRASITTDLQSIMNGTPDQWGDALAQAQKDIMMGDLYQRSGLTSFPTTDPRKTKGALSTEAKVYSEWLQRAYEIMDSKESERLGEIATAGGWIGTMNPTQEMMAMNEYLNKVTNSLTYTGLPRGTAGYLTDVVAKFAEKAPALQWGGVLPLFINASGNFVGWTITNTPVVNAVQLAKYYATGSRGNYFPNSEKELSQPGAIKVDQGKLAARVAITNAIFVTTLLVNRALRGEDDDEREKFQESIDNGTYTGYTPMRLHPAFENKGYKAGWFYYKGKPLFSYKDGGLAAFFNAVAFIDNYDKFTAAGVKGFGKDQMPFAEDSPEFAEAILDYSMLVGQTAMDQSMLNEFAKTIQEINSIAYGEEGSVAQKAGKSAMIALAKFTRSYIPYSRLQETVAQGARENKPDPITFNQRVAAGTFLEAWSESSEKVDWFGRSIKSQMNLVSPFNLLSGTANLILEDNSKIKQDPLIDLFLSKNYAPTNYPQQYVPLMVSGEDLEGVDIPQLAKELEQSPEFKAGRIGQLELKAENVDVSGEPTYKEQKFTLFLEPDEVKKVNTQKSVIAGEFTQDNLTVLSRVPNDVFAKVMNEAYAIANKIAISKQIPQVLKYMPEYTESIEKQIKRFESQYPNIGFTWPSKYK